MSSTTDYVIEKMWAHAQRFVSQVSFTCPECNEYIETEVDVPEPNFAADKTSDMTSDDVTEVECPKCGECFSAYAYAGPSHCSIELNDYPETSVSADIPHYTQPDDWDDYELPKDPFQIFMTTTTELRSMLKMHGSADPEALMNRMIFSQVIAAFEAYFCDTLIIEVTRSNDAMQKLISKDGALSEIKIGLADVLNGSNLVKEQIEFSLKNRLYHKIDDVAKLYKNALDLTIRPDRQALTDIKTAIGYRHDCVHRNGMDKSGKQLNVFDTSYVTHIIETAENFVKHTQDQIDKRLPF
ncbi:hypothetical protein NNA36_02350 [Shimia sp. CNT1-13L.2]|uniref:hypothetical protein n=1 Tax=Shimia sp. CNT1-13L.2 TaxID=2959663 RepID=UPI0020CBCF29|nr:hypothetical protein [Shimia sp. CNT1-13L.2]MCP9480796.1 hypothetical protein [Shimia sp. CNT1-13L.2]